MKQRDKNSGTTRDEDYPVAGATFQGPRLFAPATRIEDLEAMRQYIEDIDFEMLTTHKLCTSEHGGLGWSTDRASDAERQYKNWLYLRRKYEGETLPPSPDIDDFWHQHILDTYAYHRDCAHVFGHYLHHYPYFGVNGQEDLQDLLSAFDRTQELYKEEFGDYIYEFEEAEVT